MISSYYYDCISWSNSRTWLRFRFDLNSTRIKFVFIYSYKLKFKLIEKQVIRSFKTTNDILIGFVFVIPVSTYLSLSLSLSWVIFFSSDKKSRCSVRKKFRTNYITWMHIAHITVPFSNRDKIHDSICISI